ncbi:[protein-PII] uridylyltransferase [Lutimaribacter sp. EGI FJ00015]|uniref:[protein-PII] uridylyltransferase n=1 Tax=Lutimaribacter degradans TaxID=2945989 RepID=A0ACC5ZYX0_9RHOB|nr:[protein-PII] uridylyltransferase [Lutimaribacter sp. EGI FJ00013]MCM2563507.1 [protein-PII] uridylyltransferase [Lutimaribacter sp. EGI FJ00013]MCO0614687.1 [protein-PII] uridylyltransferase [Lutimaribacter sp. EGI FJ00015]MCO0637357.1 [protein-PII] uridylyltransferase [Lutimaribacter sp. EGI FJ00014]
MPVPDTGRLPFTPDILPAPPDELICAPEAVFDGPAVYGALARALDGTPDDDARSVIVQVLMDALKLGRKAIADAFAARPFAARPAVSAYTWLTDCVVTTALQLSSRVLHANATPTKGERLALFAVGGYGRGEMAPQSDVDLLFLTPTKITAWAESVIESMLYILWDLRLKVGHSSRTIRDCIRLGSDDYTIRTALLEHRWLGGDAELAQELDRRLWDELFLGSASDFIEAKLAERDSRHVKQGERYVVEPNVKEGKGGLRDLQTLYWIAKYVHRVQKVEDLVPLGVFLPDEFDTFNQAETFLWAVRCHLHLITGRPTDQLTFDMQVEVAARMGYTDKAGRRAVEHFMQDYFRHATAVGDLTRIFLTKLEADHTKGAPLLERIFRRRRRVKPGYQVVHGRLAIADNADFLSDKLNLLRLFEEALRTGMLIHPDAMRLVTANLHLVDDDMRNNREARRIFLDLLLKHGNPERALRRMNELGVLSAFIPEFEPIVAMMQFNMYHSYTVDEHTIQCIRVLSEIEHGDLTEELPVASSILQEGVNRKVLYVALLLHDIGKGRDEDHSVLGAQIARKVAPRLGLNRNDCDTVEWLVRYHLLMSDMAQKRDLSDPRTLRDFAKAVKTRKRLDLLTVLTVCDIRGVGPGTWNNWKAMLLRQLHRETARALEHGLEELNRENRGTEARRTLRAALDGWEPAAIKRETSRHYPPYWQGLDTATQVVFANLLRDLPDSEVGIDLAIDEDRDATRACFALADHPGIFSRLAGALALVGANVVDARTYTSKDGYATAVFWVQDGDGSPYEAERLPRLRQMIHKTLKGEIKTTEAIRTRDKIKKRERAFRVPTSITFDNEGSEIYTIIEVDTRDRPGLLFDLTRTLANNNVYIASAVIATYGEQVVDTFYVKDMFGLKFHSDPKQKALEKKLREAITQGVERATA